MANKYKQRRRQLRQTDNISSYDSGERTSEGATTSPLAANVETPPQGWVKYAIALMLLLAVWMVYAQTARHDFTVCDDNVYIYENPAIEQGLTHPLWGVDGLFEGGSRGFVGRGFRGLYSWLSSFRWEGIVWAFNDSHAGNWHPLTWITHMLDWQCYGQWSHEQQKYVDSWPGGHHMTNMLIHAMNTILLFLALRKLTGTQWCSAAVAMLFAIHPLRAESVAWSAERKDVLCGFFWMLTLWSYANYVRRPLIDWSSDRSIAWAVGWSVAWYLATTLMFWLALLSKSMAVTLPCVLFLLDFWPLNRLANRFRREEGESESLEARLPWLALKVGLLALEKLPWLAIVGWVSIGTIAGQHKGVALNSFDALPMWMRLVNMSLAYCAYIGQSFWPTHMAPFYTHLGMIPMGELRHSMTPEVILEAWIAGLFLMLVTCATIALAFVRRCGWAAVGWFWFLGVMVPVIGILQVGTQSRADRYTYLPTIGIAIMLVWAVRWAVEAIPELRKFVGPCVTLASAMLIVLAWLQASYWKTSYTLFEHAVCVTDRNFFAYNHLGIAFDHDANHDPNYSLTKKHRDELDHFGIPYDKAKSDEEFARTRRNDAQRSALADLSAKNFAKTIEIKPDYDFGNNNLGVYYANKNDIPHAEKYFLQALRCNDRYADVYNNLGVLYRIEAGRCLEKGLVDQANINLEKSLDSHMRGLKVRQDKASDYNNVAQTLHDLGRDTEAVEKLNNALAIDPSFSAAHLSMAEIYLKAKNLGEAEKHLVKAAEIDPTAIMMWCQWAMGLVNKGDLPLARAAGEEMVKLLPKAPIAYSLLAEVAKGAKNYDEAIALNMKAQQLDPKNPSYLYGVAAIESLRGNRDKAIQALQGSLAMEPNFLPPRLMLAQIFFSAKMYNEAIEQYKMIVGVDRGNLAAWQQLGLALLGKGDATNAALVAKQFDQVPNFVGGHELKGQIATAGLRYDEAIAEFRKVVRLEPNNAGSHHLLGITLWDAGHRTEAIVEIAEAVRLDPKNADDAAALARMRKEAGVAP